MKFTITQSEIENLIREKWNLPTTCEIDFQVGAGALYDNIKTRIEKFDPISGKIARIKELRTIYNEIGLGTLGLADAKTAIENFAIFLNFVQLNNRFPKPCYSEYLDGHTKLTFW